MRASDFTFWRQSSGTESRILEFPDLSGGLSFPFPSRNIMEFTQNKQLQQQSFQLLCYHQQCHQRMSLFSGLLKKDIFYFYFLTWEQYIPESFRECWNDLFHSHFLTFYLKWNFLPLLLLGNCSVWKVGQVGQRQESAAPQSADSWLIPVLLGAFAANRFCDQETFLAMDI